MSNKTQWWPWLIAGVLLITLTRPVWAHAVLTHATPAINASLTQTPDEIRLWFTEPLEPRFSHFTLRDMSGAPVKIPASQVDSADPKQMYGKPGHLPNGLYTVVWESVSAADGHHMEGSFAFTIGPAITPPSTPYQPRETIPLVDTLVRWINLVSLTLAVGSIGFVCFVWQPALPEHQPLLERRLQRTIWIGWLLLGLSGVLLLLLQTATMGNVPLVKTLGHPALRQIIQSTRFGTVWVARMQLWVIMGGVLWLARSHRRLRWLALALGLVILGLNSVYGHAAATHDATPAVLGDWVHLAMTALWLGGLIQFCSIIGVLRRTEVATNPTLSRLVGYFSNYARIAVAGLVVTGVYAAWLQVGSLEGLTTTLYGRALLVKLLLFVPLLAIAGVNLVITQQRLRAGQEIWAGRLRKLVSAEIVLALGILSAVGVMTAIDPARNELTQRAITKALAALPPPPPLMAMQAADNVQIHLMAAPGWVGQNRFTVILATPDNVPITDATLIRLRFESQAQNLGESELRLTAHHGNVYTATGANFSVPGDWRVRMTIQRPDQFDTVVDFTPHVPLPPPPPQPPVIDSNAPLPYRLPILLLTGVLALGLGGYFISQNGLRLGQGVGVLAATLVVMGGIFLIVAVA